MVEDPKELGYPGWGSGSIREPDWLALKTIIDYCHVKSILEVGIGLSTLLMEQKVERYVGYDSWPKHVKWMQTKVKSTTVLRLWDGKTPFNPKEFFCMAFVDGPQGARNRLPSFKSVINHCNILAMHDTGYIFNDVWRHELDPEERFHCIWPGGGFSVWALRSYGQQTLDTWRARTGSSTVSNTMGLT